MADPTIDCRVVPADHVVESVQATTLAERLRIVSGLIRLTGDWELAEDCLHDAVERALQRWPMDGIPHNPAAWLATTARHRAIDLLRRRVTEEHRRGEVLAMAELGSLDDGAATGHHVDDQLCMLFMCCHPALPMAGRVALTLKAATGMSTRDIARVFLVSEPTMSQRLLRVRNRITDAGITFRMPEPHRLAERTNDVLAVVYLLFSEGYASAPGDPSSDELATEAIRLADLLTELLPDDDEVHSLRALLCFQHARRRARVDRDGELVTMDEQDRSLWDHTSIASGLDSLGRARSSLRVPRLYRLQAEIAALHVTTGDPESTDWARIVVTYDALLDLHPSPVVALNRAVAISFRDGPDAGLDQLVALAASDELGSYPPFAAVRADLLRRAGQRSAAIDAYRSAIDLAATDPERRHLRRRLHDLSGLGGEQLQGADPVVDQSIERRSGGPRRESADARSPALRESWPGISDR